MRMESEYLVSAESVEAMNRIIPKWDDECGTINDCFFEDYSTDILEVMEAVIKTVHIMETEGQKDPFNIVGKCESDYDCIVFSIDYTGDEPVIKASQADPEENEDRYYQFCEAEYDDIPKILKRNKNRSFKQAVEELPLGGFLDVPYEKWVESIISK